MATDPNSKLYDLIEAGRSAAIVTKFLEGLSTGERMAALGYQVSQADNDFVRKIV
jgi:hypothetical protein